MRQETIVRTLYQFDELNEAAKEKARDWFREAALYGDGEFEFEYVIEDAKAIGALMGIEIDKVYYSGFSCQGDGACFEGSYRFKKDSVKAVKDFAPLDKELPVIAQGLANVQQANAFKLKAFVKHVGRYYHSNSVDIEVTNEDIDWPNDEDDKQVKELLKDFMNWTYKQLEKQNDYINSNESIDENIRANEYEFLESGKRA